MGFAHDLSFLLLLLSFASIALSTHFSFLQWSKQYSTKSKDVALSIALDDGNGYLYLVGRTSGPRGTNESFPGLVYNNAMQHNKQDASKSFHDAIIARVSKQDGAVLWASRLMLTQSSKFSTVAISEDGALVYAAGTAILSDEEHPFIVQVYDTETGKKRRKLFKSRGKGKYMISGISVFYEDVYICGRASQKVGEPVDSSAQSTGGIIVAKISRSKSIGWIRQEGQSLSSDMCSGLSLSADKETLFIAATSQREILENSRFALVLALSLAKGDLVWKKSIQISTDTDLRSSSLAVTKESIFLLTSLWTEKDNRRKIYTHKLSSAHGTLLWSKETCCTAVLDRNQSQESGEEIGSATPISGLGMAPDNYIYHLVSYRRREQPRKDTFSTHVVRVGEYGRQVPSEDVSGSVYSFRISPSEPKRAAFSNLNSGVYIVSNEVGDGPDNILQTLPILQYVSFNQSSFREISKPTQGPLYINVSLALSLSSVATEAVSDLLVEKLRISSRQIGYTSNQSTAYLSQTSQVEFWIKFYGDRNSMSRLSNETQKELNNLFSTTGAFEKNTFEKHFGLDSGSVKLSEGSINIVEEGLTASATDGGTLSANAQLNAEQALENAREGNKFKWKVFGISTACLSFIALVAGGVFYVAKQKYKPEESFVVSSVHGSPRNGNSRSSA